MKTNERSEYSFLDLVKSFKSSFMRKMYYTYVLLSSTDERFYTGYTEDLKGRFEQHTKGQVLSTRNRRPLELVYYEASRDKKDALHHERYLKTYLGKMFLRNRLKSYLTGWRS